MRLKPAWSSHVSSTEVRDGFDVAAALLVRHSSWLWKQDQRLEGEVGDWAHRRDRSPAGTDIRVQWSGEHHYLWQTYFADLNSILCIIWHVSYVNSILSFITDIPYLYLYNLFYLSNTCSDSPQFGGLCSPNYSRFCDVVWTLRRPPGVGVCNPEHRAASYHWRLPVWPPAGHVTPLAQSLPLWKPWVCEFVGGGGGWTRWTSRPSCLFSSLWWVWLSQKLHFWEVTELYTLFLFASCLCRS